MKHIYFLFGFINYSIAASQATNGESAELIDVVTFLQSTYEEVLKIDVLASTIDDRPPVTIFMALPGVQRAVKEHEELLEETANYEYIALFPDKSCIVQQLKEHEDLLDKIYSSIRDECSTESSDMADLYDIRSILINLKLSSGDLTNEYVRGNLWCSNYEDDYTCFTAGVQAIAQKGNAIWKQSHEIKAKLEIISNSVKSRYDKCAQMMLDWITDTHFSYIAGLHNCYDK